MPQAPFRHGASREDGEEEAGGDVGAAARETASTDNDDDDDIYSSCDEDDDSYGPSPPALELACAECQQVLSVRGMRVYLVADDAAPLYSTDIPSDALREGGERHIPTCACAARNVFCCRCEHTVGYHVTAPCSDCSQAGHNGHFWLFDLERVQPSERGLTWEELPYNGRPDAPADDEEAAPQGAEADECCVICAASPMWLPHSFPCGHRFCYGCCSREVDMRGACPLDRLPATRAQLLPVHAQRAGVT